MPSLDDIRHLRGEECPSVEAQRQQDQSEGTKVTGAAERRHTDLQGHDKSIDKASAFANVPL